MADTVSWIQAVPPKRKISTSVLGIFQLSRAKFLILPISQCWSERASAMFLEAETLVRAAIASAGNRADILQMTGNLGEILRAKGDLEDAVSVLRGVLAEGVGILEREVRILLHHVLPSSAPFSTRYYKRDGLQCFRYVLNGKMEI